MFARMEHGFTVAGGVAGRIPGAYGPDELDGKAEWVSLREPSDLLESLEARLGSEVDARRVLLAVLGPLRGALEGPPLEALLARLPLDLAREVPDAPLVLGAPVPPASGAGDYLDEVSRLVMFPPRAAAGYVRAVFASAKAALDPEGSEAIAARLPPDLAALWRAAR